MISLRARRKWGFIDRTHTEPENDAPELDDCCTVQSMIVSWILNTLELSLRTIRGDREGEDDMGGHQRMFLFCEWALDTIIEGRFKKVQTRGYAHGCVL